MKYPYRAYKKIYNDTEYWVIRSLVLEDCLAQAETYDAAIAEFEESEAAWLEGAAEFGLEIPTVPMDRDFFASGKFSVRIAPYMHEQAIDCAQKQGISLNQYVSMAIAMLNAKLQLSDK